MKKGVVLSTFTGPHKWPLLCLPLFVAFSSYAIQPTIVLSMIDRLFQLVGILIRNYTMLELLDVKFSKESCLCSIMILFRFN